jgi:hypothetical protein
MKLDPGMHIVMHLVFFGKTGDIDFLENEKEETFMFEQIDLTPKEPLPNYELSAMHETYASFVYTLTCCYNSHVVLIMDAYVYNKFCKS